ncbi:hypothetical protein EXN66_Car012611 [Channa argus]|uniref:Uncharacterized protein n=1 Tax=Channa argus TaxID=215402 RepID=A0A6G1Q345_CHAAH|nr:hypothetical protein EXN66_Car012611 [Channa argus]
MCICISLHCSYILEHLCEFMWLESFVVSPCVTKNTTEVTLSVKRKKNPLGETNRTPHQDMIKGKHSLCCSLRYRHKKHTDKHAGPLNIYSQCAYTAYDELPL